MRKSIAGAIVGVSISRAVVRLDDREAGSARSSPATAFTRHFQEIETMRFIVLVKGNKDTEAGVMPTEQQLADMGNFNEELVKAGVMLAGDGLHPSSKGTRIKYSKGTPTVVDGPFAETKELIAGFWMWQVKSKEEAIEWAKRAPFDPGSEIEIRQIFESEDFGAALTPELREQEERLRRQLAAQKQG
jgi:hypothetical protein